MKGFRFYAESRDTVARLKERAAQGETVDCVALLIDDCDNGGRNWRYNPQGFSTAIQDNPHSYSLNGCSVEWLATECKRIPETLARKLAPQLFNRIGEG
jgi:hypothetical protein